VARLGAVGWHHDEHAEHKVETIMVKIVLITGANAGLGKDCARQLALVAETEKIYLGCRNPARAQAAQAELEEATGRKIFEILSIDVMYLDSVRAAVAALPEPVEGLVMNAGGMGGQTPNEHTEAGASHIFAVNVLGHSLLVDELIGAGKLTKVAVYAGSEAARGVKIMMMARPALKTSSVDEIVSVIDGSMFGANADPMKSYGTIKYVAALWMSSMSRKHPDIRFVTMSPGGTSGTNAADALTGFQRVMMKNIMMPMMTLIGAMHPLSEGARRYVDALNDESFKTGVFYASASGGMTGKVGDQSEQFADLANATYQDNAHEAIHRFL